MSLASDNVRKERVAALIDAYRTASAVQFRAEPLDVRGQVAEVAARGWPEVEFMLHYATFCHAGTSAPPNAAARARAVAEMRRLADRLADPIVGAMTIAFETRERGMNDGTADRAIEQFDVDLAAAVATLDESDKGSPFCGLAYFACALAYAQAGSVELELDMYGRIDDADRRLPPDYREIARITANEVAYNRVSVLLDLACEQAELGDRSAAANLAERALALPKGRMAGLTSQEMADRSDAEARVLEALVGRSAHDAPDDRASTASHPDVIALDSLARAIRLTDAGDAAGAADAAEVTLTHLSGEVVQALRGFALSIAARRPPTAPRVERYLRLLAQMRWETRQRLVGAARARIQAESVRIENARLTERAFSDDLTGLGNRHALSRHIAVASRAVEASTVAVMMVDVDNFKGINDAFGHPVGDEVLRQLAVLLTTHVRAGDLVARIGGDEFVVIARDAQLPSALTSADRLAEIVAIHDWGTIADGLAVGVSIGVDAGPAADVEDLIDQADRGLYLAKQRGRGRAETPPD